MLTVPSQPKRGGMPSGCTSRTATSEHCSVKRVRNHASKPMSASNPIGNPAQAAAILRNRMPTIDEIVGSWDYGTLPGNIRLGANCFLEGRESFSRFRSRHSPGLLLGDRVRVLTLNVEPDGRVEIGDDTLLVG